MIDREKFGNIYSEIEKSILDSLDYIKTSNLENYILFLADGEYVEFYNRSTNDLNPFVIDYEIDKMRDQTRHDFLAAYLNTYYSFPESINCTVDNQFNIDIEIMIYTHIWEAKPFLKKLCRLSQIVNNEEYNWELEIPEMGKHDFIRNTIRENFKKSDQNIWEVMKNGFHTSLRNAFAHSEYSIDKNNSRINLYNYKGQSWELDRISFDDWSIRFVSSALLSNLLQRIIYKKRKSLNSDFNTSVFNINHPSSDGNIRTTEIEYQTKNDRFIFRR